MWTRAHSSHPETAASKGRGDGHHGRLGSRCNPPVECRYGREAGGVEEGEMWTLGWTQGGPSAWYWEGVARWRHA